MKNISDRKIFQILPNGFFNLLAGGSNQEIYSECLLLIYEQFERTTMNIYTHGDFERAQKAYDKVFQCGYDVQGEQSSVLQNIG